MFIAYQNYFYIYLLNNGWGLIDNINFIPISEYSTLSNRLVFKNYSKFFFIISYNFRHPNSLNTISFNVQHLWQCWMHFTLFYLNIQFYQIFGLVFSRIYHKSSVTYLNWISSKFSFFIWRYFVNFFFLNIIIFGVFQAYWQSFQKRFNQYTCYILI